MMVINVVGGGGGEGERGEESGRERESNTYLTCTEYTGVPQNGYEAVHCVVMKG